MALCGPFGVGFAHRPLRAEHLTGRVQFKTGEKASAGPARCAARCPAINSVVCATRYSRVVLP